MTHCLRRHGAVRAGRLLTCRGSKAAAPSHGDGPRTAANPAAALGGAGEHAGEAAAGRAKHRALIAGGRAAAAYRRARSNHGMAARQPVTATGHGASGWLHIRGAHGGRPRRVAARCRRRHCAAGCRARCRPAGFRPGGDTWSTQRRPRAADLRSRHGTAITPRRLGLLPRHGRSQTQNRHPPEVHPAPKTYLFICFAIFLPGWQPRNAFQS